MEDLTGGQQGIRELMAHMIYGQDLPGKLMDTGSLLGTIKLQEGPLCPP